MIGIGAARASIDIAHGAPTIAVAFVSIRT
jgi:hypothetical protein